MNNDITYSYYSKLKLGGGFNKKADSLKKYFEFDSYNSMKREYSDERKNRVKRDNSEILNTDKSYESKCPSFPKETDLKLLKIMQPTENSRMHSQNNDSEGSFCMKYNKSKIINETKKKKKEPFEHIVTLKNVININGLNKIKKYLKDKGIL